MAARRRQPTSSRDVLSPSLRRKYDYFRKQGYPGQQALTYAKAESEVEKRGWEIRTEYEQESYEDVYGEKPPKGMEFVTVAIVDKKGHWLGHSMGFIPNRRDDIREAAADISVEALVEEEPLFFGRRR